MEDEVVSALNASAFNVYDLLVRLVPGVVVLAPASLFLISGDYLQKLENHDVLVLLCFIAVSYAAGILLRGLVRGLMIMQFIHSKKYGGEPRDRFLELSAKKSKEMLKKKAEAKTEDEAKRIIDESVRNTDDDAAVLKYADERRLAIKCSEEIREILKDDEAKPRLCFGYMVNYLEVHGAAGKEDRVNCLADMCASLILALPIAGGECIWWLLGGPAQNNQLPAWLFAIATLVVLWPSVILATRYEQMRFSIVVRTYAILRGRTRTTDVVRPRTHQIQGSIRLTKGH